MPVAASRLEMLQVCKLLQCVRERDRKQIEKLCADGVPHLINYNDVTEGNCALGVAAVANDEDMIQFLLDLGAHPDVMDFKGRTPAMRAAEYGHTQVLEKLLLSGADMTLTDLEGKGIIFYSISPSMRHSKCVELVLQFAADVNNIARDGVPVIVRACETAAENEDLCLKLLDKGASADAKIEPPMVHEGAKRAKRTGKEGNNGRTALMAACHSGSAKVAKALLQRGANVNALDLRRNHAAHTAAREGHLDCLMVLGGFGAQFQQTNMDGNTPIHLAALGNHPLCCRYLSQRGCNPKPKNLNGFTARTWAKEEAAKDAMKELRKAEKSFGKTGKNNDPWALTLYDWLQQNQERVQEAFKELDPEAKGTAPMEDFMDLMQALSAPVEEENLKKLAMQHDKMRQEKVEYLDFLAAKKWINKKYLMSAYEKKKKKKRGGRPGRAPRFKLVMPICQKPEGPRSMFGEPPEVYIPRHIHFTDTTRFDRDNPPTHPLKDDSAWYLHHPEKCYINIIDAAKMGDFDSIRDAIRKGVSIDTRDKYYKTPLMGACTVGHLEMVKFLIENGADVNLRDNFKWTALHHACHAGQLDVVQYLVDKGAEIDFPALMGGTSLNRSIESSREGVVQYLLDKGIKLQTETKRGLNPMDTALSWADFRVIEAVGHKWEALPPIDKKKQAQKMRQKRAAAARRQAAAVTKKDDKKDEVKINLNLLDELAFQQQRKGSILRVASALAGGMDQKENISYVPLKAWTEQPTTEELIHEKVVRRERFGWEVDFPEFQMPFPLNISNRMEALEALAKEQA